MGHSQAEKTASRERILDAAARKIRQDGLYSLSIAELMKAANLTHGGFYGHFPSRDALIAAAVERALQHGAERFVAAGPPTTTKSILNRYLSPAHRDSLGEGCAIAALAGDVGRSPDPGIRAPMTKSLESAFDGMAAAMGGGEEADKAAVTAWCCMVGALALSRVFSGTQRSDDILKLARQHVLDLDEALRPGV